MAGPTPAEESVELYNEIVGSELDEQEKLAALSWRARALCRNAPSNFSARVSLASALLQTGQRAEALTELETAYGLRQIDELPPWQHLAHLFTCVLNYERATALFMAMTNQEGIRQIESVIGNAVRFAVCSGDISYLRELATVSRNSDDAMTASFALHVLEEGGLAEHIATHQRIVSDVLDGIQSWIGAAPIDEAGSPAMIEVQRFLQHGTSDRRTLRRRITGALGAYYIDQGMAPGHYMTRLHTTLIEMPDPLGAMIAA